jgi:large subunit ribosomal protein L18
MKLKFRKKMSDRLKSRAKAKVKIRKKIEGTAERPRLSVFRSSKHMYAQLIDDVAGTTIASFSSAKVEGLKSTSNCDAAKAVGANIANAAKSKNITKIVFDRSGYVYHGRIKALAEGAREAGLEF